MCEIVNKITLCILLLVRKFYMRAFDIGIGGFFSLLNNLCYVLMYIVVRLSFTKKYVNKNEQHFHV